LSTSRNGTPTSSKLRSESQAKAAKRNVHPKTPKARISFASDDQVADLPAVDRVELVDSPAAPGVSAEVYAPAHVAQPELHAQSSPAKGDGQHNANPAQVESESEKRPAAGATAAPAAAPAAQAAGNHGDKGMQVDAALFDSLVESVAPLLCDLSNEQMQNFVLHSCAKQLQDGGDIDPDKIANAVFSIDQSSAEWQARMEPPTNIRVHRAAASTQSGQDLRVLQVAIGRPPLARCCSPRQVVHSFTFDAGSSKVLSEVDRCIRSVVDASMQYMATDKQVPYLLLSPDGDVLVLTKELLKACPTAAPAALKPSASQPDAAHPLLAPLRASVQVPRLHLVRKGLGSIAWDIGSGAMMTWRLLALGLNATLLWLACGMQWAAFLTCIQAVLLGITQDALRCAFILQAALLTAVSWDDDALQLSSDNTTGSQQSSVQPLLYIAAVAIGAICVAQVARAYAAAYLLRWAFVHYAFLAWGSLRALCTSASRPPAPGYSRTAWCCCTRKPTRLLVGWDEGLVWRRAHFVWSDGSGGGAHSAPVRLFSLAWLAGEKAPAAESANSSESKAQTAVLDGALAAMDDSAYTAWQATVRAAAGWQADHLSLDVVMSSMGSKLQHQVMSREFVAKWPHWQRVVRAGSAVHPAVLRSWQPPHTQQCILDDAAAQDRLTLCCKPQTWLSLLFTVLSTCLHALAAGNLVGASRLATAACSGVLSAAGAAPALEVAQTYTASSWALHRTGELHQLQSWRAHMARMQLGLVNTLRAALGQGILWAALLYPIFHAGFNNEKPLPEYTQGSSAWGSAASLVESMGVPRGGTVLLLSVCLLVNITDVTMEYWSRFYAQVCSRRRASDIPAPPRQSLQARGLSALQGGIVRLLLAAGRTAALLVPATTVFFAASVVHVDVWSGSLWCIIVFGVCGAFALMSQALRTASGLQRAITMACISTCSYALGAGAIVYASSFATGVFFILPGVLLGAVAVDCALQLLKHREPCTSAAWMLSGPIMQSVRGACGAVAAGVPSMLGPLQPIVLDAVALLAVAAVLSAWWRIPTQGTELGTTGDLRWLSRLCAELLQSLQSALTA